VSRLAIDGTSPVVADSAFIAPGVFLLGDVTIGEQASIWCTNLQDGTIVHADPGFPVSVGSGVSVGHRAVLHGCTVEDDVLIGMGATVLNGARIGTGSLVAAGAVILEGTEIPPRSLVAGLPGKVRRELGEEELDRIRLNAQVYLQLASTHRAANG
jgi:carbonic anhydrase/acetyltransferase-like protein (isoleucine patch superfamily)